MNKSLLPDASDLSNILRYCHKTGKLYWRPRPLEMFHSESDCRSWNKKYADQETFTSTDQYGYKSGSVFGRAQKAHRVVWALCNGDWPKGHIDHINGVKSDNRLGNLRDVSRSENQKNISISKRNISGVVGVSWDKEKNKWRASINVSGKTVRIGRFKRFDDAISARKAAEVKYGFHPNHGRIAA